MILMSGCWTVPNANLRPKGEPRVIDDSIEVEALMPSLRVESIDRVKRIVRVKYRQEVIAMEVAAGVGSLNEVDPGDYIRPKVRKKLKVYVASQSGSGDDSAGAGWRTPRVLVVDTSYRLLSIQYPDGHADTFKVGLDMRLKAIEPGDSVEFGAIEVVDLGARHRLSRK